MKYATCFFLFLTALLLRAQNNPPIIEYRDINGDGAKDSLVVEYDSGSGFGGYICTVKNGKTGEHLEWYTDHCFCAITDVELIPDEFRKPENQKFRQAIEKHIRIPERKSIDPSLAWILNGLITYEDFENDTAVQRCFTGRRDFTAGHFTQKSMPESYSIPLEGKALQAFCLIGYLDPVLLHGGDEGWLTYSTASHFMNSFNLGIHYPQPLDTLGEQVLLSTHHGLVLQEKDRWSWIWVTDHYLTGSPDKLRFTSILSAQFVRPEYILVFYMSEGFSHQCALVHLPDAKVTVFGEEYLTWHTDPRVEGDRIFLKDDMNHEMAWDLNEMIRLAETHQK